jgi:hypothetical protein
MTRIQTACWALTASAVILSGLLVFAIGSRASNEAQAQLVTTRDNVTVMTADTREGEQALFILDHNLGALLVYRTDGRDELEPVGILNVNEVFR